jgi:hypothetical protein
MGFNSAFKSLMKIRPVGAELLHTDGRTDMMKLVVIFRNFAKAHENQFLGHNGRC